MSTRPIARPSQDYLSPDLLSTAFSRVKINRVMLTIQNGEDDVHPVPDTTDRDGGDLHDHVIEYPIAGSRN